MLLEGTLGAISGRFPAEWQKGDLGQEKGRQGMKLGKWKAAQDSPGPGVEWRWQQRLPPRACGPWSPAQDFLVLHQLNSW